METIQFSEEDIYTD